VELTPEERKQVVRILGEFYRSWMLLRQYQAMDSLEDIQADRDNRLGRAIGRRRAKEIAKNIDEIVRRPWGGRGGGGR
jgi:hypothetical protein